MPKNPDPIVRALEPYSTCDVSDALLKLKHPHGGFLSGITMWSPQRQEGTTKIVGPAYTVRYAMKGEPGGGGKVEGHYADLIPADSVLFISAPPNTVNAVYGGLMTHRAYNSGAAGTIVDGRIRDLQEHRQLEYPVFAQDIGTTAPQELLRVESINTPVALSSPHQSATINPGDYLIGDLNGVVCISKHLASQVIDLIPLQVAADQEIANDLGRGRTFAEASKKHRAHVKMPNL